MYNGKNNLCEMRGVSVEIKLFNFTTNGCLMLE